MGFITLNNAIKVAVLIGLLVLTYYIINIGNRFVDHNSEIPLSKRNILKVLGIIFFIAIIYLAWTNFPVIGQLLSILLGSLVFSYLLSPLVARLENRLVERNISSFWAIIIIYAVIVAILGLLIGTIVPAIVREFIKFFHYLPNLVLAANNFTNKFLDKMVKAGLPLSINELVDQGQSLLTSMITKSQTKILGHIGSMPNKIPNFLSVFVLLAIIPIVSFYLLKDRYKILRKLRAFIEKNDKHRILDLAKELNLVMSDYIRGRLIMCLFVGVGTAITMFILKIDFALVVGIITGIADIIPYIGPFIGFLPAIILAAIDSPVKALVVGIIFVLLQWLENNLVGPIILSDRVGLHPVVILFTIFIGGSIGGVLGMIFLTPIVVALKVIYEHFEIEIKGFVKKHLKFRGNNETNRNE